MGERRVSVGVAASLDASRRALIAFNSAIGLGVGVALFACGSEDEVAERAVASPAVAEKLSVEEIAIGDGTECEGAGEIVTIHYRGMLLDGHVFDSSYERGAPIVASLESLIPGWRQGIPGMRIGGKRRLTVPANLAYSGMAAVPAVNTGAGGAGEILIPPGSTLVFEIELLDVRAEDAPEAQSDIARSASESSDLRSPPRRSPGDRAPGQR